MDALGFRVWGKGLGVKVRFWGLGCTLQSFLELPSSVDFLGFRIKGKGLGFRVRFSV